MVENNVGQNRERVFEKQLLSWFSVHLKQLYSPGPKLINCFLVSWLNYLEIGMFVPEDQLYRLQHVNSGIFPIILHNLPQITHLPKLPYKYRPSFKDFCHELKHHIGHSFPLLKQNIQLRDQMVDDQRGNFGTGRWENGWVVKELFWKAEVYQANDVLDAWVTDVVEGSF